MSDDVKTIEDIWDKAIEESSSFIELVRFFADQVNPLGTMAAIGDLAKQVVILMAEQLQEGQDDESEEK